MWSRLSKVWRWTRDGWRYAQIRSTSFILGAHLDPTSRTGYSGGVKHPAGTWLVWQPGEPYAAAVRDEAFDGWLEAHGGAR